MINPAELWYWNGYFDASKIIIMTNTEETERLLREILIVVSDIRALLEKKETGEKLPITLEG